MIVETHIRGSEVEFTATFIDEDGNEIDPNTVAIAINFLNSDGQRETEFIDLTSESDGWVALWDSSSAQPARVYWSLKTTGPISADDGFFDLKGNPANLAEESS